jgi:hypothetical protein
MPVIKLLFVDPVPRVMNILYGVWVIYEKSTNRDVFFIYVMVI